MLGWIIIHHGRTSFADLKFNAPQTSIIYKYMYKYITLLIWIFKNKGGSLGTICVKHSKKNENTATFFKFNELNQVG